MKIALLFLLVVFSVKSHSEEPPVTAKPEKQSNYEKTRLELQRVKELAQKYQETLGEKADALTLQLRFASNNNEMFAVTKNYCDHALADRAAVHNRFGHLIETLSDSMANDLESIRQSSDTEEVKKKKHDACKALYDELTASIDLIMTEVHEKYSAAVVPQIRALSVLNRAAGLKK